MGDIFQLNTIENGLLLPTLCVYGCVRMCAIMYLQKEKKGYETKKLPEKRPQITFTAYENTGKE